MKKLLYHFGLLPEKNELYQSHMAGAISSGVERLVDIEEATSSNLVSPTIFLLSTLFKNYFPEAPDAWNCVIPDDVVWLEHICVERNV